MTTSHFANPPQEEAVETTPDSELDLKKLIEQQYQTTDHSSKEDNGYSKSEQDEFNNLSRETKFDRLNNLIEKSQIYSKIIADNILQSVLAKNDNSSQTTSSHGHSESSIGKASSTKSSPARKKRKTTKNMPKKSQDVVSMLKTDISESTVATREAIEKSQSAHTMKQPKIVSGCVMKDYQLDGLEWLVTLYENGLNGILADEMGLGKTLQCISFLGYLIENGITGPFLVVVPLSTLSNWYNELQKFAPKIKVLKYSGSKQERAQLNLEGKKFNIVLTSYEISMKDFGKFSKVTWQYLIVDEGHRLKNSQCLLIKVLKKLDVTNRLLLTGTPLQNNLNELWSLLNFILPDIFHDLELFQQWFDFDQLANFEQNEEDEETKTIIKLNIQETLVKNLHTILKPFILRRLKKDVIKDLPPKKEYIIHIPLTELQRKIYRDALDGRLQKGLVESNLKEFLAYNHANLFENYDIDAFLDNVDSVLNGNTLKNANKSYQEAESDDEFETVDEVDDLTAIPRSSTTSYEEVVNKLDTFGGREDKQIAVLKALYTDIVSHIKHLKLQALKMIQLRNICNSPYLYYEPFPIDGQHDDQFVSKLVQNSTKFRALEQILLPLIASGHKCLIFSQFTRVMDLIQDWLHFQNIDVCRLDGSTAQAEREDQISLFNESQSSVKVFLLSTRAGGLGINLTAADTVFLFDSDWNPQVDLQAIDRVHRIGQEKPVKIFRFVVRDSIEEILISKSSSKRFLEKLIIQMGEFKFSKLKQMMGNSGSELDASMKELFEWSKHNFNSSDLPDNKQQQQQQQQQGNNKPVTNEELQELLDRSDACYQNTDDSKFKNITIFETTNNLDK
ncbi:IRC5 [Candida theae]|uniref:IRC5 n=1 Tax=Candida theae TaxID=1198502 RepID=A0AAD5BBN4_9ASCO|nr:IRC5 [Candida theae]KAI5950059.1 IRC5 [Candida theae]